MYLRRDGTLDSSCFSSSVIVESLCYSLTSSFCTHAIGHSDFDDSSVRTLCALSLSLSLALLFYEMKTIFISPPYLLRLRSFHRSFRSGGTTAISSHHPVNLRSSFFSLLPSRFAATTHPCTFLFVAGVKLARV